jgi:hypothetical protein
MIVRSASDEAEEVSCTGEIGDRFLFGGAPDGSGVRFDPAERRISWSGTIPPHGERRFAFSVVAPLWMHGYSIYASVSARRTNEPNGVYRSADVEIREARWSGVGWGVRVGPVIFGPYELVLLGALFVSAVIGLWLRRRLSKTPVPAAFAAGGCMTSFMLLTILGLFAVDGTRTLITDIHRWRSWRPVPCTVVDAAAAYESGGTSSRPGGKSPKGSYAPLAVTRYQVDGAWRTALGFWSDSHIFVSGRAARLVEPYRPGMATTCWVDPDYPGRFVLDRTPGFGHLGLLVIVAVVGALVWLPIRFRRRGEPAAAEPGGPFLGA